MNLFLTLRSCLLNAFSIIIINIAFCISIVYANNLEGIKLEDAPSWVIPHEIILAKDIPVDEVRNGIFYQLLDNQIQVSESGIRTTFSRYIDTIVNQAGLEGSSQLNFSFDPSYQEFSLNSLFIIRNGQRLNRLHQAKKSLLNTESELKRQIYNGSLTLNILLSDLQIGDNIEYSYTVYGANPVYKNAFAYRRYVSWSVPVHAQHLRLLWGKSNPIFITTRNVTPTLKEREVGAFTEYQISMHNQQIVDAPSQIPDWYNPYGLVYFSETESWKDVITWAIPLYQFDELHPSVLEIAKTIKNQHQDIPNQIAAALKYTQENIRYVGLEMGKNSHVPTAPEETLSLKYGDCKDKASLMIAILKALNIEAFPALVDTDETKLLNEQPPSSNLFDHVIVTLEHDNKQIWLDPTLNHQHGSLSTLYQPNYGYALILKQGEDGLRSMNSPSDNTYSHYTEKYFLPKSVEEKATFSVQSEYSGRKAIDILNHIDQEGKSKLSEDYKIYYQRKYPKLDIDSAMEITSLPNTGVVQISEHYKIEDFWTLGDEHYEVGFYPTDIRDAVFKPTQISRNGPLAVKYPNNINNNYEIEFESDGWDLENEEFVEDNSMFYFKKDISFKNNVLKVNFEYHAKTDHITSLQIENYLTARDTLRDEAYYGLTKFVKNTEEIEEPISWLQIVIIVYSLGLLFIVVSWRLESRKRPTFNDTHFYPMPLSKFLILSIFTMGTYEMYWMYRNWYAQKKNPLFSDIMPVPRGIFTPVWFYPLFTVLKNDSLERFNKNKVLTPFMAAIFTVTYLVIDLYGAYSDHIVVTVLALLTPLLFIPLVLYIKSINQQADTAYQYNSKWSVRHIVAIILCAPLIAYTLAVETPFLPGDSIRTESQMLESDLKFLYRKKVLPANEKIQYFYSDAFLSIRDDGNGYTENRVFSYWVDDTEGFQFETATYEQIKNIEVEYATEEDSNTIITVTTNNNSNFMLFVSSVEGGDKVFFNEMNTLWKEH